AWYRLGVLRQAAAYRAAAASPARMRWERGSLDAYAQALALAPTEGLYLVAYGNQALNLGELELAASTFARAHALDPLAPDPLVGLGESALRRGDRAAALRALAQANALAPDDPAVRRFREELARKS
ncbi:MAG: tetratricopeptide repeat protein, partial [Vulcanimicrobiaceae bacterium]